MEIAGQSGEVRAFINVSRKAFDLWAGRYYLFLPLHHLWLGYMSELLGLLSPPTSHATATHTIPNAAGMHTRLVKADFHGSIMTGAHLSTYAHDEYN